MSTDWAQIAGSVVLAGLGSGGGVWAWMAQRARGRPTVMSNAVDLQKALGAQASAFIGLLQSECAELRKEMDRRSLAHAAEIAELRTQHTTCVSENAQLLQRLESLQAGLRRQGIDVPELRAARPLILLQDGQEAVQIANTPEEVT